MNALRTLHPLLKVPGFRDICFNEHKFTPSTFDGYVKEAKRLFNESIANSGNEDWTLYINSVGSMIAFSDAFPERLNEFSDIITSLIYVVKEKIEVNRKNSAILLAKLAKDEGNEKIMRANHGFEILLSLRG